MVNRDGKRDYNLEFNENDPDPTKEAFFSDMGNIEKEITSEALELVKHALSLLEAQFYDDSIEILRQAVGLYTQINRDSEVETIKGKISEIYLLREENFKKRELETINEFENNQGEIISEQDEDILYSKADRLIVEAISYVNNRKFDQALDTYDNAITMLKKLNKGFEIEKVNELIEDCYNRKADYIRKQKSSPIEEEATENSTSELELKAKRIKAYEDAKRKETKFSNQAYELIGKATELRKIRQFDEAIGLFEKSISLFKEINWLNEVKKIENMKEQVERDKERYNLELQQIREREEQELEEKKKEEAQLIERATIEENLKQKAQAAKLRKQIERKQEDEIFQNNLTDMIDNAEKLAREYELNLKKTINKGSIIEECAYPRVIEIYEKVRDKAKERGWKDQVKLYEDQIQHYQILLEKDRKLRYMEAQKIQKQKLFDESIKIKKETAVSEIDSEKLKTLEEQKRKEIEIKKSKEILNESVKLAEKMAREYEVAFKKAAKTGNLNFDSKYPEILKIYTDAREKALEKGWNDDSAIYSSQIRKYTELAERDIKIREIEAKKNQDQKVFEDYRKVQKESVDIENATQLEKPRIKGVKDKKFQLELTELINEVEKMARDYDLALKKGLKDGKLIEESPFNKIIEKYNQVREKVISKGWTDQASIYTNQINIYREKWEKDKKIRELELQKIQKQKEFEDSLKVKADSAITAESLKDLDFKRKLDNEEQDFQNEITDLVEKAEKMARDYGIEMKKALKNGKLFENSPYLEIIEIYSHIRKKILEKGWTDQGLIYTNQIKIYQDKLEKDKKLREIESEKVKKQQEFIEAQKSQVKEGPTVYDAEKLRRIEELTKQEQKEKLFEHEIDEIVDNTEKEAREYELAIMKGQFDKKCPYLKIAEIYKNLRKKVYARGWRDEAEIYANQIILYKAKYQKDKRLRELEIQKVKKQQEFDESLKAPTEIKPLKLDKLAALDSKNKEADEIMTQALNLIDNAEKAVRNYEVNLKRDILSFKSPYEGVIKMYAKARKMLQKIGWNEEAQKLNNTISFYESKRLKDDNLRAFELQKIEESKTTQVLIHKDDHLIQEKRIDELRKLKEAKSKESEEILNKISQAEKMAKNYEMKKKKGVLKVESPYKKIIQIYKTAKLDFEKIGWVEQADQLVNSINYYQEKLEVNKRLRVLELERAAKQEEEIKRFEKDAQKAQQAEEELSRLKIETLEEKRKKVMKYESKREQAFNFMDLAKREFKQNNFDKAISFYKESQKIFDEINWSEGIKMIKESINAINLKRQRIERERISLAQKKLEKLKIETQLEEQIIKAKDLQNIQQKQRRRELSAIQKEKEREKEISDRAYHLLEEGTKLKDNKKFEDSYEKYIMARDLFKKIDWQIEVSRINNDLLITLNKEKKQTARLEALKQKKVEKEKELKLILKEADAKQKELDHIRKEEKKKQREKLIQKERDLANDIIKDLKYNEGILALRKVIKKIENTAQDKLVKEMKKQIEVLENASQVPIITKHDLDDKEDIEKFRLAYQALDKAQISLSNNLFMKSITEFREAIYNLTETKIGKSYILEIEDKINIYKKELDIKKVPELKKVSPKLDEEDLRAKIARRREERRKRINELMDKK